MLVKTACMGIQRGGTNVAYNAREETCVAMDGGCLAVCASVRLF